MTHAEILDPSTPDPQINEGVAVAAGWKEVNCGPGRKHLEPGPWYVHGGDAWVHANDLPNYCQDLNAVRPVLLATWEKDEYKFKSGMLTLFGSTWKLVTGQDVLWSPERDVQFYTNPRLICQAILIARLDEINEKLGGVK